MKHRRPWVPLSAALLALLLLFGACAPTSSPGPTPGPTPALPVSTQDPLSDPVAAHVKQAPDRADISFQQMRYERPDIEQARAKMQGILESMRGADSAQRQVDLLLEADEWMRSLTDMYYLAYVRFTLDTTDQTWADEKQFTSKFMADLSELSNELDTLLVQSPYKAQLTEYLGEQAMAAIELSVRYYDKRIADLSVEINDLDTQYSQTINQYAQAGVELYGASYSIQQMNAILLFDQNLSAKDRGEVERKVKAYYDELNGKCSDIFSQMLALRMEQAKIAGFDSYPQYRFATKNAGYSLEDVFEFLQNVKTYMVPVLKDMRAAAQARIGDQPLSILNFYPAMCPPDANISVQFFGEDDDQETRETKAIAVAQQIVSSVAPQASEMVDYMNRYGLIDARSSATKDVGAYAIFFPGAAQPFIMSQSPEPTTLIHEMGHALDLYLTPRIDVYTRYSCDSDISEVHSYGMEFLSHAFYDQLYGDTAPDARMTAVFESFYTLVTQAMFFDFERTLYENPNMTTAQRNELYVRLSREYGLDLSGLYVYDSGVYWTDIPHLFSSPLYMINYSLAMTCAFDLWEMSQTDWQAARGLYMDYTTAHEWITLPGRLDAVGLDSPFDPDALQELSLMLAGYFSSDAFQNAGR